MRIGVTGHRHYDDRSVVAAMTDVVLDRLLAGGATPTIISSLAEGADRMVPELALTRAGARLEAILPFARQVYEFDFVTAQSREHFARLLDASSSVEIVEAREDDSREAAFERAGRAVVDTSEVLIAIWDGEPSRGRGGTAEMIQYALDRDVLVEIVLARRRSAG